jgi:hypothetical protein
MGEFGSHTKREMLISLGRLSEVDRERDAWFGLFLWERKQIKGRNETAIILQRWIHSNAG